MQEAISSLNVYKHAYHVMCHDCHPKLMIISTYYVDTTNENEILMQYTNCFEASVTRLDTKA